MDSKKIEKLEEALRLYNQGHEELWAKVVDATNDLVRDPGFKYNPYEFPIEVEREVDQGALCTG